MFSIFSSSYAFDSRFECSGIVTTCVSKCLIQLQTIIDTAVFLVDNQRSASLNWVEAFEVFYEICWYRLLRDIICRFLPEVYYVYIAITDSIPEGWESFCMSSYMYRTKRTKPTLILI